MAVIRPPPSSNNSRLQGRDFVLCVNLKYLSRFLFYLFLSIIILYGLYVKKAAPTSIENQLSNHKVLQSPPDQQPFPPLRTSNLDIIKKATAVDISFIDVTRGGNTDLQDPHRGAQDENGNWGYVPDAKALGRNPPEFNLTGTALVDACNIRDSDYKMIHDKVSIIRDADQQKEATQSHDQQEHSTKILCIVQTSGHRHAEKIPAIRRTWGPKCDGFVVASNITDRSLGTVRIPHNSETDVFKRKWLRVITTWSFIYDNYYQDYDWFYFSNDMVYLLVENLRLYLESKEMHTATNYGIEQQPPDGASTILKGVKQKLQVPIFLGRRFALGGDRNDIFNAGGPGYVVNKAALKVFVVNGAGELPQKHTSKEDLMIARTFRRFGVYPYDTQDETGGERFMITTPGHHLDSQFPAWYHKQSMDIQHGVDHCAKRSISFHYVPVALMYRLHALLYGKCPS